MKFSNRVAATLLLCLLLAILYHTHRLVNQIVLKSEDPPDQSLHSYRHAHRQHVPADVGRNKYVRREEARTDIRTIDLLRAFDNTLDPRMYRNDSSSLAFPPPNPTPYEDAGGKWQRDETLEIIVVPHSHNDPGWLKTVDSYFEDQTNHTLNHMVDKLLKYPLMTFVWAETVFLSMWWRGLNADKRRAVRGLIQRGQLEIVGGGWVVPDEANPHYYALIDQMIEGHQWLEHNMGVRPRNTWSLDPFGYSSVLAYLYRRAGFENMVVLRVHGEVKEELGRRKALEFWWRQGWDGAAGENGDGLAGGNETDILTLMMPYMLYSIKHSCGPDTQVCLQYDFRKIAGEVTDGRSRPVHPGNALAQARRLLAQYRLKVALFRHNVVLVPLGDDFRFDHALEWDQQYTNYQRLFETMNARKDWRVRARFGTPQDYFDEVRRRAAAHPDTNVFPTLSGDFFPYTDREAEYWTGYYSTRPFAKSLGRDVEVYLRSADMLHFLVLQTSGGRGGKGRSYNRAEARRRLSLIRRHLGLFQHHDAITGTARNFVAIDYETRLDDALRLARSVVRDAILFFMPTLEASARVLEPPNARVLAASASVVHIPAVGCRVIVFNSVARQRRTLLRLTVDRRVVSVTDASGTRVPVQVGPAWGPSGEDLLEDLFDLAFFVDIPALAAVEFVLREVQEMEDSRDVATVKHYDADESAVDVIALDNGVIRAKVSIKLGQLVSLGLAEGLGQDDSVCVRMMTYTSRRSGAYIFAPVGPATDEHFTAPPAVTLVRGQLFSELRAVHRHAVHILRVTNSSHAVEIDNIADISRLDERELVMRVESTVRNGAVFHTDQNGFVTVRRKRFQRVPIEANYYPSTSMVFIEDSKARIGSGGRRRLTLVTGQPLGVSSQGEGSMEAMLDRRLLYDDQRGMGEGVLDNRPVLSRFVLILEHAVATPADSFATSPLRAVASLATQHAADELRNYVMIALANNYEPPPGAPLGVLRGLRSGERLPCDVLLVGLRALAGTQNGARQVALILHRLEHDDSFVGAGGEYHPPQCEAGGGVTPGRMFADARVVAVKRTSLSLMHDEADGLEPEREVSLDPNHLYAFKLIYQ